MSNVNSKRARRGFSLIEALASVALLGFGVASVVGALGVIAKTESRLKQTETMTRLAQHKFDELVATSTSMTSGSNQNGDFTDENNHDYLWSCDIEDTGVTNLEAVTVTVTLASDTSTTAPVGKICTLVYIPPVATTTGGTQ